MSALGEVPAARAMVDWRAIIAGAVAAAGLSFTLHAFAAGVGLAVISTAPTWRDSSGGLWVLSGVYLVFASLCAFSLGGYIAGLMRARMTSRSIELEYHDGVHGLLSWALAILIAAMLAVASAATIAPAVAPGGTAGASQSVAGENIIASELDELFRDSRDGANLAYHRAEAARILLKSSGHDGVSNDDRDALTTITAQATGLAPETAMLRADHAIEQSRNELRRARIAAVLQAFFIGAALLVGIAVAWFSAVEGGRHRDEGRVQTWHWGRRRT